MNTTYSTPPQSKAELIKRIRASRALVEELIQSIPTVILLQAGPDGGWSIQDHLAHLSEWCWKLLAMIRGRPGYEGLRVDAETDQTAGLDGINAILYERNRGRGTDEVLADFRRAHAEVLVAVEQLDEADLSRAYDLTDPTDPRQLLEGIIGNTYGHDLEHLAYIHAILDAQSHI